MDIKNATINDAEAVVAFINARWDVGLKKATGDMNLSQLPGRTQLLDKISNGEEFIASQEGKVIGVVTLLNENAAYAGVKWEMKDSSPIYIDWLFVDPTLNKSELKKELMLFAEKMAIKKGAKSIRLNEYETELLPLAFYSNLGYKRIGDAEMERTDLNVIFFEKKLS